MRLPSADFIRATQSDALQTRPDIRLLRSQRISIIANVAVGWPLNGVAATLMWGLVSGRLTREHLGTANKVGQAQEIIAARERGEFLMDDVPE
jgi:hypothetical protein